MSKPWAWGHEVAEAFYRRGDLEAVNRHLAEMLAPLGPRQVQPQHASFQARSLQYLALHGSKTVTQRLADVKTLREFSASGCAAKFGIAADP